MSPPIACLGQTQVYEWSKGACNAVEDLDGKQILSVQGGGGHVLALSRRGDVYVWGDNRSGQLGLGKEEREASKPVCLPSISDVGVVTKVVAGPLQSAAFTDEGEVYLWGLLPRQPQWKPVSVAEATGCTFGGKQVVDVSFGPHMVAFLVSANPGAFTAKDLYKAKKETLESEVWVWGSSHGKGLLGLGQEAHRVDEPVELQMLSTVGVVRVVAGETHMSALTIDGRAYLWGGNPEGELGLGRTGHVCEPVLLAALKSSFINDILLGERFTVALTSSGNVYSWGTGRHGVLGHGDEVMQSEPKKVTGLASKSVVHISTGGTHSFASTKDGKLFGWGRGSRGRLGEEDEHDRLVPTPLTFLANKVKVVQLSATFRGGIILVSNDSLIVHYKRLAQPFPLEGMRSLGDLLSAAIRHWRLPDATWFLRNIQGRAMNLTMKLSHLAAGEERMFLVAAPSDVPPDMGATFGDADDMGRRQIETASRQRLLEYLTEADASTGVDRTEYKESEWEWFLLNSDLLGYDALFLTDSLIACYEKGESVLHVFTEHDEELARQIADACLTKRQVLRLLIAWMSHYPNDIVYHPRGPEISRRLSAFALGHAKVAFPSLSQRLRSILAHLTASAHRLSVDLRPPATEAVASTTTRSAEVLAKQLTLRAQPLLALLGPKECLWQESDTEESCLFRCSHERLMQVVEHYFRTRDWAVTRVLDLPCSLERLAMAEKMAAIMDACIALGNFHSAAAICSGLNSPAIAGLPCLQEKLSAEVKEMLAGAEEKIAAASRSMHNAVAVPPIDPEIVAMSRCLPFVGFLVRDVKEAMQEQPAGKVVNIGPARKVSGVLRVLSLAKKYRILPVQDAVPFISLSSELWTPSTAVRFSSMIAQKDIEHQESALDQLMRAAAPPIAIMPYSASSRLAAQLEQAGLEYAFVATRKLTKSELDSRQLLWEEWARKLTASRSRKDTNGERLGGKEASFEEAFWHSNCLQMVVDTALRHYPQAQGAGSGGEGALRSIFKASLRPSVPVDDLMAMLRELSECPLTDDKIRAVARLVATYQPSASSRIDQQRKQTIDHLAELERSRSLDSEAVPKALADGLEMATLSNDIVAAYSMKLALGEELHGRAEALVTSLAQVPLQELEKLCSQPLQTVSVDHAARVAEREEKDMENVNTLHDIEENELTYEEQLLELEQEEQKLMAALRAVRSRKADCQQKLRRLHADKDASARRAEALQKQWTVVEGRFTRFEQLAKSSDKFFLTAGTSFLQTAHKAIAKEVASGADDLAKERDTYAEEFIFALVKHLDAQQELLTATQEMGTSGDVEVTKRVLLEAERMLHSCRALVAAHSQPLSRFASSAELAEQLYLCSQLLELMLQDFLPERSS